MVYSFANIALILSLIIKSPLPGPLTKYSVPIDIDKFFANAFPMDGPIGRVYSLFCQSNFMVGENNRRGDRANFAAKKS